MTLLKTYPATPHVSLDPQVAALLASRVGFTPFYKMPLSEGRSAFELLYSLAPKLNDPIAKVEDRTIAGPVGEFDIRIYQPQAAGKRAILLYIHGGGWVIGSPQSHDDLCQSLCSRGQVVVVSVDYHRAPEHRFPVALHECYAALQWCAQSGLGDPIRLAVAGDSAGGNLTAALSLYARDQGGPQLKLQVPIYPVTNRNFDTASYYENAEGYGLLRDAMIFYWDCYLAKPEDGLNPYASPLLAPDLRGLPPALIQTAQYDVLRDEGEAYAHRLRRAGVPVRLTRYLTMNHGFVQFGAMYPDARVAVDEIAGALREI